MSRGVWTGIVAPAVPVFDYPYERGGPCGCRHWSGPVVMTVGIATMRPWDGLTRWLAPDSFPMEDQPVKLVLTDRVAGSHCSSLGLVHEPMDMQAEVLAFEPASTGLLMGIGTVSVIGADHFYHRHRPAQLLRAETQSG